MSEKVTPENRRVDRYRIETAVPAVSHLREAREAGEPDVVAFSSYAKRVREGLILSTRSRAREAR